MLKPQMIQKAIEKHGEIFPIEGKESILDSFTTEKDCEIFWFNDKAGSTHIIIEKNLN